MVRYKCFHEAGRSVTIVVSRNNRGTMVNQEGHRFVQTGVTAPCASVCGSRKERVQWRVVQLSDGIYFSTIIQ